MKATTEQQKINTIKAYEKSDKEYSRSVLEDICSDGEDNKEAIYSLMKSEDGLLMFSRPLTEDELLDTDRLSHLMLDNEVHYSFSFISKTVTERATGHCKPLKRFLKEIGDNYTDEFIESTLELCSQTKELLISCNPWFLIGSSVASNGRNVENSCHHPANGTEDYKSGAISYALDKHTIIFGSWKDTGLTGRQLVYVDTENTGIVTGRLYGDMSESDSTFLRKELYKLMSSESLKSWKKTGNYNISKGQYSGYLDRDYFQGYRPQHETALQINLVSAVCPLCGDKHSDGFLLCSDCYDSNSYTCDSCGERLHEDDMYHSDDGCYCQSCFDERYFYCNECGDTHSIDERVTVSGFRTNTDMCKDCADKKGYYCCSDCGDYHEDINETVDGELYCDDCLPSDMVHCEECSLYEYEKYMNKTTEDTFYCPSCLPSDYVECEKCKLYSNDTTETIEGKSFCSDCSGSLNVCDSCGESTTEELYETVDGEAVCIKCRPAYACSSCGKFSDMPGVCSHECALNNLFGK